MRNNLELLVQYVRKRKLFIFVSAIKGTIVCSMLLLFIANSSNINIIGNKIPEYPKLTSDYNQEGNYFQFRLCIYIVSLKNKNFYSSMTFSWFLGSNQIRFKLEHCNCTRKITRGNYHRTRSLGGIEDEKGNYKFKIRNFVVLT